MDELFVQRRDTCPRASHVLRDLPCAETNDDCVGGQQLEQGSGNRAFRVLFISAKVDGQHVRLRQFSRRTLVQDVEAADRLDLVAPELDSHRVPCRD